MWVFDGLICWIGDGGYGWFIKFVRMFFGGYMVFSLKCLVR